LALPDVEKLKANERSGQFNADATSDFGAVASVFVVRANQLLVGQVRKEVLLGQC
jgi:hypothetical protein